MRRMLSRFRLSPAFPISLIALFVALGGVGYAAATIGTKDLKNNAVTSKKIKNHTIKKKDLKFNPTGPAGPQGPAGPAGASTTISGDVFQTDRLGSIDTRSGSLADPVNNPPASLVLAASDGFAWVLLCPATGAGPITNNASVLAVVNVSGGDDSHAQSGSILDNNFDEGTADTFVFDFVNGNNLMQQSAPTLIYGTAGDGSTQEGMGGVLNNPAGGQFAGDPDCVGSVNLLAG
jgi:hypothetical protein